MKKYISQFILIFFGVCISQSVNAQDTVQIILEGEEAYSFSRNSAQIPTLSIQNVGQNILIGDSTGASIQIAEPMGTLNVMIGDRVASKDAFSTFNTIIGSRAAFHANNASDNTIIGFNGGYNLTSGQANVLIGGNVARNLKTGSQNVYIGVLSGLFNESGSRNVFIGHNAGFSYTGSNQLIIENSTTTSPLIYGKFDEDYVQINGDFLVDSAKLYNSSEGDFIIENDQQDNQLVLDKEGFVGIGTDIPGAKFQVGTMGDGTVAQANAWNTFSDVRWKKDIDKISGALEKVKQLNGYYYFWKSEADKKRQIGLLAQEIETLFPEMVHDNIEGYKSVDYSKMVAVLIEAIKEQQDEIDQLKKLEQRISDLEARLK